ncbi:hypothetical protein GGP41_009736 [Bipolaris sorokiniana]|uniref:Uncharacterized protein n=1 Tax=Cochliobolus sativus TaxID=45130 RepID=A0A8H5ZE95_COCSA|nr:hypothetical protein GGP41_009736 [Bipolaris sorokiniana]
MQSRGKYRCIGDRASYGASRKRASFQGTARGLARLRWARPSQAKTALSPLEALDVGDRPPERVLEHVEKGRWGEGGSRWEHHGSPETVIVAAQTLSICLVRPSLPLLHRLPAARPPVRHAGNVTRQSKKPPPPRPLVPSSPPHHPCRHHCCSSARSHLLHILALPLAPKHPGLPAPRQCICTYILSTQVHMYLLACTWPFSKPSSPNCPARVPSPLATVGQEKNKVRKIPRSDDMTKINIQGRPGLHLGGV